jgi:hypothetical protein
MRLWGNKRKEAKEQKAIEALPLHVKRSKQRKIERKKRMWSDNRPTRPESDTLYDQFAFIVANMGGSAWEVADKTGLSTSTVYSLRHKAGKTSLGTTMQMIAKAAGGRLVFVKDGGNDT